MIAGNVCAKSDVWALGITIMQLLQGVSPLEHLPDLQMTERIMNGPPPVLPDSFSPAARAVVASCLKIDMQERGSLNDVTQLEFVARAPPRERALTSLINRVLAIKEEKEREEETARRRALVK